VVWIVQYFLKQLIVSVLQQLMEVWYVIVRWAEAASLAAAEKCVYALAVRRRDVKSDTKKSNDAVRELALEKYS